MYNKCKPSVDYFRIMDNISTCEQKQTRISISNTLETKNKIPAGKKQPFNFHSMAIYTQTLYLIQNVFYWREAAAAIT